MNELDKAMENLRKAMNGEAVTLTNYKGTFQDRSNMSNKSFYETKERNATYRAIAISRRSHK